MGAGVCLNSSPCVYIHIFSSFGLLRGSRSNDIPKSVSTSSNQILTSSCHSIVKGTWATWYDSSTGAEKI